VRKLRALNLSLDSRIPIVLSELAAVFARQAGTAMPMKEIGMRCALVAAATLLIFQSVEASSEQYVNFINDGDSSVVAIEMATPGSEHWTPVKLSGVIDGGYVSLEGGYVGQAMTKIHADSGCMYDVRIVFADHQALLLEGLNVCRTHAVHIGQQWRRALLESTRAST
jgi:hypothetical protein